MTGWVHEVFASIQGEGLYCGERQTFVRLAGCNLDCRYCDTPAAREPNPATCRIETSPGSGSFTELRNPLSVNTVLRACRQLGSVSVTLTGGEPLLQPEFAAALARGLKENGHRVHLETNGALHENLRPVLPFVDVVAMDVKIPSAAGCELWREHKRFLEIVSARGARVFVKAIVSDKSTVKEIARCAGLIAFRDRSIPLVIQPVTGARAVPGRRLMRLQEVALEKLEDVRVIPQCHKVMGIQ